MQKTRSAKAPLKSPASQRLLNLRTRLERAVEKAKRFSMNSMAILTSNQAWRAISRWLHDHKLGVQCLDLRPTTENRSQRAQGRRLRPAPVFRFARVRAVNLSRSGLALRVAAAR